MLLIGENLNVINRVIGKAFKEKDPGDRRNGGWTGSTSTWVLPERGALS